MQYQHKIQILGALSAVLLLLLIGTFIFNPDTTFVRQSTSRLLEKQTIQKVTKIAIKSADLQELTFIKRTGQWYLLREPKEYPVKMQRIEDMLKPFGNSFIVPVRATTAQAHERLGVGASASHITMWAENAEKPVLDLYFGSLDATGKEIYFRSANSDVVKSIEDHFSSYIQSSPQSWYDLRLFPQTGAQALKSELVQKISCSGNSSGNFSLSRTGPASWSGAGGNLNSKELDTKKIDTYIQDLIYASGDDFVDSMNEKALSDKTTIVLELGDGRTKKITIISDHESRSHWATVTDTPYIYQLSEWQYNKIVKESTYFIKTEQ